MNNATLDQKREQLQQLLPDLRERYGVTKMWLFGSYVRGEQTAASDLDVLVSFDNDTLTLIQFIELQLELSDKLGVKVDLVEREGLKPYIGAQVIQEMVTV